MSEMLTILEGDVLERLAGLPDESVHCVVTSPPYWGLRDYGVDGQIGLEKTPEEYVAKMVEVFREVQRVLRPDGSCFINLGDSYWGGKGQSNYAFQGRRTSNSINGKEHNITGMGETRPQDGSHPILKPKDLVGIPWRVAFALQADGWYLRQDIIWCLSGGTWLYVHTDTSGECLMTVKDLYRLKPAWVRLWNGKQWTGILGISKSARRGDEIELVLRSGERISCTPTHRFPTSRGLLAASEIRVGDTLQRCQLPKPYPVKDCSIDLDAAWLAGLYLAEGSRSEDTIQIAGHTKEENRWKSVCRIAAKFGGSATRTVDGNNMTIRIYGRILNAIIGELVCGRTAHDKGFSPLVWRYSNEFIAAMLRGYLEGDGCFDAKNNRWRLGFCRNYNLERDLRTACARLGYHLVLNLSSVPYNGKMVPTFKGEIRETRSGHHNEKNTTEVVEIRKARCREVYDLGVACEPHLFALASGILTHNSKPNPMPESVTDRCTKAHEYIFLLAKNERYFWDAEAVKEAASGNKPWSASSNGGDLDGSRNDVHSPTLGVAANGSRNRRSVWTVPSQPYPESHFATFSEDLIKPCILAGTSARGCCPKCGAPWERIVESKSISEYRPETTGLAKKTALGQLARTTPQGRTCGHAESKTLGWQPICECGETSTVPCTVLDPFFGSGTVGQVSLEFGRKCIGIELNPKYVELAKKRCDVTPGLPLA